MKCVSTSILAGIIGSLALPAAAEQRSLSQDWLFQKGDVAGAQNVATDDKGWVHVSVPHDGSIMDKPDGSPPFDPKAESGQDSGYLPGGIGWYRRHINLTAEEAAKILRLNFEAVYMDADIWLNGKKITRHAYGYSAFTVDLTGLVKAGDNVLAVRINHADPSSRWYAGSGIIRPVTLDLLNCVHLEADSVFVTTPVVTAQKAQISTEAVTGICAARPQPVELESRLVASDREVVARSVEKQTLPPKGQLKWQQKLTVSQPKLWSTRAPNLYWLEQTLRVAGKVVDERRTRFGMRTIEVDANKGLRVNGEPVELRGGNIHNDNYMLGGAGIADADARKVALLKAAGYNAIRNAHNPASQATLEAADELGMLVIDEAFDAWNKDKRPQDYARFFAANWAKDIDSMVISGRNHPSVLFWSIGNEIPEQGKPQGIETARKLTARVRALDPSRLVTQAVNIGPPDSAGQYAEVDVAGYNYKPEQFAPDHAPFPNRIMYTSESTSKDAFQYWRPVETMPSVIGDFVWTAFDYIGEAAIGWMGYSQDWQKLGPYPWNLAYSGEIDATGRKRPAAYYREVLWKTGIDPISAFVKQPDGTEDLPDGDYYPITPPHLDWSLEDVHPSWTWRGQEGKTVDVVVYSEYPEVELRLNGKSLGRKQVGKDHAYKVSYSVPYAPGMLEAVCYENGRIAGRWVLRTAQKAADMQLSVDRSQIKADGQSLAYVRIELVDAKGTPIYVRSDDLMAHVRVTGAGRLAGIGNGDPQDVSSLQSGDRKTFHGQVVAVIQAGISARPIGVEVKFDGLPERHIRIDALSE
ncbi:MAG: glycoside hydrolase family 2 TIM barrel-domain containing protein [Asticcacaulis sp.]